MSLGCQSDVNRMSLECHSDVNQMLIGCQSDVNQGAGENGAIGQNKQTPHEYSTKHKVHQLCPYLGVELGLSWSKNLADLRSFANLQYSWLLKICQLAECRSWSWKTYCEISQSKSGQTHKIKVTDCQSRDIVLHSGRYAIFVWASFL